MIGWKARPKGEDGWNEGGLSGLNKNYPLNQKSQTLTQPRLVKTSDRIRRGRAEESILTRTYERANA